MIAVVERAHHPVEHLGRPVEPQFLAELIRRVEALDESVWLHRRQCHAWRAAPAFQALLKIILGVIGYRGDRKSVVSGKSVSVRVDLGCRSIIQKNTKININIVILKY